MSQADTKLVDRCRQGDRQAFAEIVERYKNLVSSIAYSGTGNQCVSEELAQETFVVAWQSLRELREPDRLKSWLCGIVRNLVHHSLRRGKRDVLQSAGMIDPSSALSQAVDPLQASIANEEAAIIRQTLDAIPETYREPLVLYYREQESVSRVAQLLGLSEDAVKQRLARGRKMLRGEIAAVVERGIRQSIPGRAFTMGVLAALPTISGVAQAATVGATGAKGVSAMHAAGWIGILGSILGPVVGIAGAVFGIRMGLKSARSDRERRFLIRTCWATGLLVVFFTAALFAIIWGRTYLQVSPTAWAISIVVLTSTYIVLLLTSIVIFNKWQARIQIEEGGMQPTPDEVAAKMPAMLKRWQYPAIYDSPTRFLGLPLVSIRFNGISTRRPPAVGWIAIGDMAIGVLFANGAIAIGGIACGAVSFGLLAFGGLAMGLATLGGASVGALANGGFAIGYFAFGGVAVAWKAAMGGVAVAHDQAIGGIAIAEHANDAVAKQFINDNTFFQFADFLSKNGWIWLIFVVVMMLPMLWAHKRASSLTVPSS